MRLAASSLLFLLASCTTEREWKNVASTITIGYGTYASGDISKGVRSYDMNQGDEVFVSFRPFVNWEQPRPVYLVAPPPPMPTPKIEMVKPK